MLWGAISYHGRSELIVLHWPRTMLGRDGRPKKSGFTNKQYAEQVLEGALATFYEEQLTLTGLELKVIEDGAPVHKGPFVRAARTRHPYPNVTHPPSSPDLNCIENIWHSLKKRIWEIPHAHSSMNNLKATAQEVWKSIPQGEIQTLIDSMPQ